MSTIQITYPIQIKQRIKNQALARICNFWPFINKVLDRLPSRTLQQLYTDDYTVNERIVEHPFVHANLADIPPNGKVLDVGSNSSPIILELAALGFNVTALDINETFLQHPNVTSVKGTICNSSFADETFEAVTCISTLEHIGLGHYGDSTETDSDIKAVQEISRILKRHGKFILTVPYGIRTTTSFLRIYDKELLNSLISSFEKLSELYAVKTNPKCWIRSNEEFTSKQQLEGLGRIHGVVCLSLRKRTEAS